MNAPDLPAGLEFQDVAANRLPRDLKFANEKLVADLSTRRKQKNDLVMAIFGPHRLTRSLLRSAGRLSLQTATSAASQLGCRMNPRVRRKIWSEYFPKSKGIAEILDCSAAQSPQVTPIKPP